MHDPGSAYHDEWTSLWAVPVTSSERRKARIVARTLWLVASALLLLTAWLCLPGCRASEAREADPLMYSRAFQQLGAEEVWVSVIGGDGHVVGQAYNLMGIHWAAIAKFRPSEASLERIREFFPTTQPSGQ